MVKFSTRCVVTRMGAGTYRSLLERFVGPEPTRMHSKDRVVDAA